MKQFFCLIGLTLLTVAPGFSQEAASSKVRWLRRLTLGAACAASFWDVRSTQSALASGAVEANPLFSDRNGNTRMGRMIGFKIGACAGLGLVQELRLFGRSRNAETGWIAANTAMAGAWVAIVARNKAVESSLK
jgi:hypothetical protein